MISAFGVEHGEISKGVPKGMNASSPYGHRRMMAHVEGKQAAYLKAKGESGPTIAESSGRFNRKVSRLLTSPGEKRKGRKLP
jgi:hypothetical protein